LRSKQVLKQPLLAATGKEMFFIPSVFSDPSTFESVAVMDGELNWYVYLPPIFVENFS
jgi:hypothetical protein